MRTKVGIRLSDSDLRFVVETVATQRKDHDRVIELVRDKPDILDVMLADDKLFRRIMEDEEAFVKVSPWLFFAVLVRKAIKDLSVERFTIERVGTSERIPVFDVDRVLNLVEDVALRDYLIDLLASFVRTESKTMWYRAGRHYRRRTYSDLDLDDMIKLAGDVDSELRFPYLKRIGDICLFTTGIFPEHALFGHLPTIGLQAVARRGRGRRSLAEYESEGARFYGLAAAHPRAKETGLDSVLTTLAENFDLARKPLNLLSDRFIRFHKARLFEQEN